MTRTASTSRYTRPIPAEVIERLPMVLTNHPRMFNIQIEGFNGNDGEQMFSIDVYTDAELVTPDDRRQKPFTEAKVTSYFFNADGGFDGEPSTVTRRL